MNNNVRAILLTISGSFFAVLMEALVREAQYDSNVYTIGFLRFFFGLMIIFPYLIKFHSQPALHNQLQLQLVFFYF